MNFVIFHHTGYKQYGGNSTRKFHKSRNHKRLIRLAGVLQVMRFLLFEGLSLAFKERLHDRLIVKAKENIFKLVQRRRPKPEDDERNEY